MLYSNFSGSFHIFILSFFNLSCFCFFSLNVLFNLSRKFLPFFIKDINYKLFFKNIFLAIIENKPHNIEVWPHKTAKTLIKNHQDIFKFFQETMLVYKTLFKLGNIT